MTIPTVKLYGISVSKMNMEQTVDYLAQAVAQRSINQVVTANPIIFMDALDNPEYLTIMKSAELVVPDGTGLVWAAKHVGQPVAERVAGYDLLHKLAARGGTEGWRVYLLGASPDVIHIAAKNLEMMYPGLVIAGARDGFFTEQQDAEVIAEVIAAKPDLLFVANSGARQDPWIGKYKLKLNIPVMMGVGGSFDIIAGKLKRAPLIFQKMRVEWLFRLILEPWRYKRMLVLPKFVWRVLRENPLAPKN